MKEEKNKFVKWVKDHRDELIIAGIFSIGVIIALILICRNKESLYTLWKSICAQLSNPSSAPDDLSKKNNKSNIEKPVASSTSVVDDKVISESLPSSDSVVSNDIKLEDYAQANTKSSCTSEIVYRPKTKVTEIILEKGYAYQDPDTNPHYRAVIDIDGDRWCKHPYGITIYDEKNNIVEEHNWLDSREECNRYASKYCITSMAERIY